MLYSLQGLAQTIVSCCISVPKYRCTVVSHFTNTFTLCTTVDMLTSVNTAHYHRTQYMHKHTSTELKSLRARMSTQAHSAEAIISNHLRDYKQKQGCNPALCAGLHPCQTSVPHTGYTHTRHTQTDTHTHTQTHTPPRDKGPLSRMCGHTDIGIHVALAVRMLASTSLCVDANM